MKHNVRILSLMAAFGASLAVTSCTEAPVEIRDLKVDLPSPYAPATAAVRGQVILPSSNGSTSGLTAKIMYGDDASDSLTLASDGKFNVSHTYTKAGNFTATVEVTTQTARGAKTVDVSVAKQVSDVGIKCQVCDDQGVCTANDCPMADGVATVTDFASYSAVATGGIGALAYHWNFGDHTVLQEGKVVAHQYLRSGSYTIALNVEDQGGSQASYLMPVTVTAAKEVRVMVASPTTSGQAPVEFTVTTRADGSFPLIMHADWKDGSTASVANYPSTGVAGEALPFTHTYTRGGAFAATFTAEDKFGRTSTQVVNFNVTAPVATSSSDGATSAAATSAMGTSSSTMTASSSAVTASSSAVTASSSAVTASSSAVTASSSAAAPASSTMTASSSAVTASSSAVTVSSSAAAPASSAAAQSSSAAAPASSAAAQSSSGI